VRQHSCKPSVAVLERVDGKKAHNEYCDDQKGMVLVCFQLLAGPCDQFLHEARRIERSRSFEDDADASAVLVERLYVVWRFFVLASMMFVSVREIQQGAVKLLDVVFVERNFLPRIEHHPRCFRIPGTLLLVSRPKRTQIKIR